MKKKESSSPKEAGPMTSKRKENVIESKGQTKTPKKTKSSPTKKEVEIFYKCTIWGLCVCLSLMVFKFYF